MMARCRSRLRTRRAAPCVPLTEEALVSRFRSSQTPAALGAMLIGRSLVLSGESVARFHVLPLALIAAAVCLFGALIEPLGLVLSLVVLTLMSVSAGAQFRLLETLALTVLLIVFSVGVFVYALGLPLNIWPSL